MISLYDEALRSKKNTLATRDGSATLYSEEFGEAYHSTKDGALHESLAKHVRPALTLQQDKKRLTILDICFGLGYNSFATLYDLQSRNLETKVHIVSPEFDEALVRSLKDFAYPPEFDGLRPVIEAISNRLYYEDERFTIEVMIGDARALLSQTMTQTFDIVYQDAFSPKVNPLLWTKEWFADIRAHCRDDAVLTTYSVAAAMRMGLYENGFVLYEYQAHQARKSLIASPTPIVSSELSLSPIDMALKMERNPSAKSLRDADYR